MAMHAWGGHRQGLLLWSVGRYLAGLFAARGRGPDVADDEQAPGEVAPGCQCPVPTQRDAAAIAVGAGVACQCCQVLYSKRHDAMFVVVCAIMAASVGVISQ